MSHRVAVYVVLRRGADVLFMHRRGTGYRDGEYGLPSGKVDPGETLVEAARREVEEEVGVVLDAEQLAFAHAVERVTPTGLWLDWFFVADRWEGSPANREPAKCAGLAWLPVDDGRVSDYVRSALEAVGAGRPFARFTGE